MRADPADSSVRQGTRGASIVEAVVAIAVLSLCMAGLYRLVTASRRLMESARAHYTAVNVAKNRIESAHNLDFSRLSLLVENRARVDPSGTLSTNGLFRRSTIVTNLPDGMTEVAVTVEILDRTTATFTSREGLRCKLTEFAELPR